MTRWWQIGAAQRPLPEDELRRQRREVVMILVTGLAFLIFALLETRLPSFSNSSSLSGNIIFFLLINLNLLLLGFLAFLVMRNLVKLVLERRRGIFGSRLRTRLALAFVTLSLVPSVLQFLAAQGLLTAAFDAWFNVRIESSLRGAQEVSESYYQFAASNALHFAAEIGNQVTHKGLLQRGRRNALQRLLDDKRRELNVAAIVVHDQDKAVLAQSTGDQVRPPSDARDNLDDVLAGQALARTIRFGRGDTVRGAAPIRDATGAVLGVATIDYPVPRNVSEKARDTMQAYQEFRQLSVIQQPIKSGYILTLSLITLVVIFSAMWFGFRQAKAITDPLERLAEGTREVAQGNWSHRIEASGDDETSVLVQSFNQMTADLQKINSELVDRRKYLENLLANIAAGVVSLSQKGTLTTLNPAAEDMLGLRLAQVRGKSWHDVFETPHLRKIGEVIGEALATPQREVQRQIKLTGGDRIVTALVTATLLADDAAQPRGLMLFFEDVTHLLRVQRMEAWREVARRLAHEIKNPLTPIQLSAQRLRKRYGPQLNEDGGVFDECTRTIIGQVDELKRLVSEFSTFARLPNTELTPQDLNSIIEETLVLYREGHPDVEFELHTAPALPPIDLDRDALKRALINLLDNAVAACHAAPDGPRRIEIATSHVVTRRVLRLEVADTGCGMSREVKLRLFEPYFSTKREGTGLGLAIVSSIIADHQGYIRVQDNQPRGSRFIIELPVRDATESVRLASHA